MQIDFTLNIVVLINVLLTTGGFLLIKFNDFKHLTKDVEKLSKKVDFIDREVGHARQDIAILKEKTKDT